MMTIHCHAHFTRSLVTALLMVSYGAVAEEIRLVSPSEFANNESHDSLPAIPGGAGRAQFLFESSDFSSLDGPHWITEFAWRPDGALNAATVTASSESVVFSMSTTDKTVRTMSMVFAENIGADEQVVAQMDEPQSTSSLVSGPEGGPKEFTISSVLQVPFLYDPRQGSLLLDMELVSGSALVADNVATPSRDLTTKWIAGPRNGARAFKQFGGIVTEFAFVPVIEGDFDRSGTLDAADIDLLSVEARMPEPGNVAAFDLNADDLVSHADREVWIEELFGTVLGDANLDKKVDFDDFNTLSQNFSTEGGWAEGDFDGSGDIQFADFVLLSANFASSTTVATVPEPSSGMMFLLSMVSLAHCRLTWCRRFRRSRH